MRALVFVATAAALVTRLAQPLPDTTVKAAFLARFPEFVEWPAPTGPTAQQLSICLSPAHPFGTKVAESAGSSVRGRAVRVRTLGRNGVVDGCDVLYVAERDATLLRRAQRLPILTVGDQPNFCELGGVINLRVIDRRVRFEIDLAQAREVGLTIDSQLLRLAVRVHEGRPQ